METQIIATYSKNKRDVVAGTIPKQEIQPSEMRMVWRELKAEAVFEMVDCIYVDISEI